MGNWQPGSPDFRSDVVIDEQPLVSTHQPALISSSAVWRQPQGTSLGSPLNGNQLHAWLRVPPRSWSTSLWDCTSDMDVCWYVCFCWYCALFDLSDETGDDASLLCPCMVLCWLCDYRFKLRNQLNIKGSDEDDCIQVLCCPRCVVCQMLREIKIVKGQAISQIV